MEAYRNNGEMNFFETRKWLGLRYEAIKVKGRKCAQCGNEGGKIEVSHIKPRSKFPNLELCFENLQVLCRACNMGKSNLDSTDWRSNTKLA